MSTPVATAPWGGVDVRVRSVVRTYGSGAAAVQALRGSSFEVAAGQLTALQGRSGSGKSTLLNIIGGLDQPDSGTVQVGSTEVTSLRRDDRARLRRETVAFIFQSYALIPILTALENVAVPMRLVGTDPAERDERALLLLRMVGLGDHAHQRAHELSGGQQQRVAIARALANRPKLLIADEPTGQLDSGNARQIMELMRTLCDAEGVTILVATHDPAVIASADRVLRISDGVVSPVEQEAEPAPAEPEAIAPEPVAAAFEPPAPEPPAPEPPAPEPEALAPEPSAAAPESPPDPYSMWRRPPGEPPRGS
jgi:putative ABC transport system ATP-binding protein